MEQGGSPTLLGCRPFLSADGQAAAEGQSTSEQRWPSCTSSRCVWRGSCQPARPPNRKLGLNLECGAPYLPASRSCAGRHHPLVRVTFDAR